MLMLITISSITIYAQQTSPNNSYSALNNKIYVNNSEIQLNGISWSGAESASLVPDGLWKRNYKEMITQIKSLGFNSVRFPFCPATLKNLPTNGINYFANPTLKDKKSLDVMDIILDEFAKQEIYILIDHHRPDCKAISDLWYTDTYTEKEWISDLVFIADRYKTNPYFMGLDIKNEPHGTATWGNKNPKTDFNIAAQKVAKVIALVNPNILTFVEGIGNNDTCDAPEEKWWGGNFSPMLCTPFEYTGINPNKIVFSPHVYGPDVYNQGYFAGDLKTTLPPIWESHFGFLTKTVTVVPGEFGGFYRPGSVDRVWQDTVIDYFISKKICNTFYWEFNPNSGDTGGVLNDDWLTVNLDKVNNLKRLYKACNPNYNPPAYKQINLVPTLDKITTKFVVSASGDWGFCGDFNIVNTNYTKSNMVKLTFDSRMVARESWNGTIQRAKIGSKWTMTPNKEYSKTLSEYSTTNMGFCSATPYNIFSLPRNMKVEIN